MHPFVRLLLTTAGIAVSSMAPLHAQMIDYAGLQDTFGEPVTTSVTGKPQRASTAPASIVIITRDQIVRSPSRSVPDLLKTYAGVDVNQWTAGQSDVAVRGGVQPYNARLLVLVNGRQVYLDHYGMTDWNLLGVSLEAIQQIELVRGPASALFGFNAASGVVNIITVNPAAARHAAVTAEAGTHAYSRVSGDLAAPLSDTVSVELSGDHRREDDRAVPGTIGRPRTIPDVTADAVNGTIVFTPTVDTRAELNGGYSNNRQLEFLPSEILTEQRFRNRTAGLTVDHDTGWGSLTGNAYTNWLDSDYGITGTARGPFEALANSQFRNRIIVAKGASLIRLGSANVLRFGIEYRNNQLWSSSLYSHRIGYQDVAADGMIDLHPSDRIALSVAGRIDHLWLDQGGDPEAPVIDPPSTYNRALTRFSFNAALLVQVGGNGQLRINGGRGEQSPSLIDLGLRVQLPAETAPILVFITGDPRIEPSAVWSAEIGYAHQLASGIRIDGTIFYTQVSDAIASPGSAPNYSITFTPDPVVAARFANADSFKTYGVSLAASGKIVGSLVWTANYAWTHVVDAFAASPPFSYALSPAATTPMHVANVGLDYGGARWFGSATARYSSATRQFAFDNHANLILFAVRQAIAVDAKLGFHVSRHLDVYVAGQNLSNAGGASGSPIPADRRLRIGLSIVL